ncbi:hypothetical protein AK812_SmicGene16600 [Symbiodinium microadriaticum]|uniref:Uncharacterized protein n=1 Tax=Symbiodinium microadriaticum TaxID=2951 RepID=A0A1Q9DZV2_SYMMI|nr:hypothetical protein AK812_SmicGene16600 [Symbiodinium microadriaticum]
MRITAKPENAKLLEAVREIGDLNEVAKEFISAVNQGYLHGPCRSVAVSVGKSLLGLEKQISILLESTEGDSYQALLCDDMSGWLLVEVSTEDDVAFRISEPRMYGKA